MKLKTRDIKHRVTWGFNPVTRVVPSKKNYNRKKEKQKLKSISITLHI